MGLFSKPEIVEVILPFVYDTNPADVEPCIITIEAYGQVLGEHKYFYVSFEVGAEHYDELSQRLICAEQKFVKIDAKVKNGKVKGFRVDLADLAQRYGDERFEKLGLLGDGVNERSFVGA